MNHITMHRTIALVATPLALAACLTLVSASAGAQDRRFEVREDGGSRAQFTSDAPLETMTGVTSHVFGEIRADPADLAGASGSVEVRTGTLRTGIDLRDEHLRSATWLDAARFPTIRFELTSVSNAVPLAANVETRVVLRGRLSLHGRTRDVQANARVTWIPGDAGGSGTIRVRAHFGIRLSDYDISIGEIVRLKVSNEIGIDVSLRAISRS